MPLPKATALTYEHKDSRTSKTTTEFLFKIICKPRCKNKINPYGGPDPALVDTDYFAIFGYSFWQFLLCLILYYIPVVCSIRYIGLYREVANTFSHVITHFIRNYGCHYKKLTLLFVGRDR